MQHVRVGDMVPAGEPVFTIHAETAGELAYALAYAGSRPHIVNLEER
jgi:thymidine phosphorylase